MRSGLARSEDFRNTAASGNARRRKSRLADYRLSHVKYYLDENGVNQDRVRF